MDSPSRRSTLTIALCFIVALIEGFDLQAAGTAAAGLRQSFALDPKMLGWVFSIGIIGLLPGAFFGGWVADRIGRKKILVIAVLLFGLFSLSTAFVESYPNLLLVRFLTGLGLGAALPNLIALCAEAVSERNRGTAISVMYCGVPLGGALAAVVAMFSSEHWQTTFIIGGLAPLLAVPLMILLLPESTAFRQQRDNTPGARPSTGQALFGEGRARTTLALWLSYFFTLTVMYMLLNWLPSLLLEQGFSKPQAGIVQMLFNIGGALGSLLGGVLLDRCNAVKVVLSVYAGLLAALAGVGLSVGIVPMAIAGFAAGLFVMAAQLVLYASAPPSYPTSVRATGVGAAVAVGRLGSVAGPLAAGQLLAAGAGTAGVLLATSPGVVIAALTIISVMVRTAPLNLPTPAAAGHTKA
ncbi:MULTISPECIES: 3-(3-hydroxy-phenyl)propionate transporter MhpT [unclassified Pseudomonas]|uniref:3-(3-hydroxy-phenyl)propionate transporter MhpT n=1 Tax=unclassified Pseudomonas TaxID=196821 RepID=UPI000C888211|nr:MULTISPECIES: 3-(3-hydroxy-phenyl)propionate transporter MhpT [unclassified Pseudomonas]PMX28268.1 3-(3-hydroxy-phenyl)propionate transporter MhpT [Pseudomonas sp. GW460-12]PMX36275.1 3-(3-hydroxy-phenyl)propionate transporter MhpT [Pseudomonas sp. MPR-R2A4]PMX42539.1 3-(3-hydroxy-phenyl)propionate transporter MhpT [Pseudomonas sp. MPR-R2A7]PMX54550.1 3-(3-hydroxy-phenyl)propionate transporter MhpT [Pseudomonas sp. MPR-R2A6]PMX91958.1 3-(3-hydroxy-phenyl)propionate transporter MhpT [Pseudom